MILPKEPGLKRRLVYGEIIRKRNFDLKNKKDYDIEFDNFIQNYDFPDIPAPLSPLPPLPLPPLPPPRPPRLSITFLREDAFDHFNIIEYDDDVDQNLNHGGVEHQNNENYENLVRLEPIKLGLISKELISKSKINILYEKRLDFDEIEYNICIICQEKFNLFEIVRTLNCDHFFHINCVDNWLSEKNTCPLCKDYIGESNFN